VPDQDDLSHAAALLSAERLSDFAALAKPVSRRNGAGALRVPRTPIDIAKERPMARFILTITAAALSLPALAAAQEDALDEGRTGPVEARDESYMRVAEDIEVWTTDGRRVGEIEDVLLDEAGRPAGYVVEIDGFLGILDRDVQVPMDSLTWEDSHFVSKMTEEQLENLAPWDE
jgi:hypothetical protein